MRVIVTSPNWTLNGVNTFSLSLVRGLRGRGADVTLLVTGSIWRDEKPLPAPDDISLERLTLPRLATWEARWRALRQYLENAAPCVYLPNHDILHSGIAPTLSSRIGIVGIVHSDDPQHFDHAQRLGRWWNGVVGVSEVITRRLRGSVELTGVRIEHIPYGVPPTGDGRFSDEDRVCDDAVAPLRILYAGRLIQRQKRVGDLLDIALALQARGAPFVMTIAGDGPEREPLERRSRSAELSSSVRFIGTVAPDAMAALHRSHDVFLLPSEYEGLPLALLEAMGQGCAPVVSDIEGGVSELVRDGENGFRIPVGDIEGFATRLAELAAAPRLCRGLGTRARETAASGVFGYDTMITRYASLLSSVWSDVAGGRYTRAPGPIVVPPSLDWRGRVRAPLAAWRWHS